MCILNQKLASVCYMLPRTTKLSLELEGFLEFWLVKAYYYLAVHFSYRNAHLA